jgi:DNA-binding IclR family transcriptional regulator
VETDKERQGIQSVEVGFTLLDVMAAAQGPMMLRDLAAQSGMSPAKAHRYLVSYQRLGMVVQDSQTTRYDLGPAALRLGLAALSRIDAVRLARRLVADLAPQLGQTLALAVWGNRGPTIVHWEEAPQSVTVNLRLGDVMPLLSSATGRCFAAYAPQDAIQAMLQAELVAARASGRTDLPLTPADAQRLLADTRQQGIARVINTLLPGIVGFCAPVFDASGHLALGIVTLGSHPSLDVRLDGAAATTLKAAAAQLSRDLGFDAAALKATGTAATASNR